MPDNTHPQGARESGGAIDRVTNLPYSREEKRERSISVSLLGFPCLLTLAVEEPYQRDCFVGTEINGYTVQRSDRAWLSGPGVPYGLDLSYNGTTVPCGQRAAVCTVLVGLNK